RVTVEDEGEIGFQEYFVRRHHDVAVTSVRFDGGDAARPGPDVLAAIRDAERLVIAPSNPIVSIDPVLVVPRVRGAGVARREGGGAGPPGRAGPALKGPADRLPVELGHESSVVGVGRVFGPLGAVVGIDEADGGLAGAGEGEGMGFVVAPTVMTGPP